MKLLTFLALSLFSLTATAGQLETVAIAALTTAFNAPRGQEVEHGGILVKRGRRIFPTGWIVGNNDHLEWKIDTKELAKKHEVLVAFFHTHPCQPIKHVPQAFSPADIDGPYELGIPGFLLNECDGSVHEWDPHVDTIMTNAIVIRDMDDPAIPPVVLSRGRIIGNIGKTGKILPNE